MRFFIRLFFLLNVVIAGALLLAFVSPYISPEISYIPEILALGYRILFLLNLCFIVFWWFFQKRKMILSLLVCVLFLFYTPRLYKFSSTKKDVVQNNSISLVTYNVHDFTGNNRLESKAYIFTFLKEVDATVVCFQEYNNVRYKEYGQKYLKKLYPYSQINREKRETAIFSKYPIIKKQDIVFPPSHNCSGIFADIVIKNDTLRVFNVHLESNRISQQNKGELEQIVNERKYNHKVIRGIGAKIYQASKRRVEQISILTGLIQQSPYRVVVCGDFNDIPLSYTYERIAQLLSDSFSEKGIGNGTTFKEGIINVRIDYVFSSLITIEHKILPIAYSDHFPLKVVLQLNK